MNGDIVNTFSYAIAIAANAFTFVILAVLSSNRVNRRFAFVAIGHLVNAALYSVELAFELKGDAAIYFVIYSVYGLPSLLVWFGMSRLPVRAFLVILPAFIGLQTGLHALSQVNTLALWLTHAMTMGLWVAAAWLAWRDLSVDRVVKGAVASLFVARGLLVLAIGAAFVSSANLPVWVGIGAGLLAMANGAALVCFAYSRLQTHYDRAMQAARRDAGAMRAALRTQDVFISGMSHELRTPLNAVIGYGDLMAQNWSQHAHKLSEYRAAIAQGRQRLIDILDEIALFLSVQAVRWRPAGGSSGAATAVATGVDLTGGHYDILVDRLRTLSVSGTVTSVVDPDHMVLSARWPATDGLHQTLSGIFEGRVDPYVSRASIKADLSLCLIETIVAQADGDIEYHTRDNSDYIRVRLPIGEARWKEAS
ncbi:phospho-acceptor domain-containing protein [Rhodothalassium salexigens DSM 2132]|uniref:histidine kinase n=1 Tax=Rhodothalassium salexigens DSM 2132 TaxID=1188247 RepID=A0A4R2PU16_RHOSA|nr:histidine kinase dimerization/phospho-acceptor domain-containing protein [Rhodothalassium salexigens]MBB4210794.1 signal transduction histidine kinase [Rhodothalassium salexigens DSM 2132]MBK1639127.1 hypothetical protein [Rhodothalassium salexigens DSM 2132]TCP37651.1 phospho-acceptor domain-containing protein [Rhodothalassium salexigens DSM 2132]